MNSALEPTPVPPDKLKPLLHDKIEHMDAARLSLLNRILLQLEAEELADHLSDSFDAGLKSDTPQQIAALITEFRAQHRYA